ncbi:hypothetical protein K504DRAFT_494889 [Pleomassaria siparia CBS 279.74]|uniref:Cytochrome P450 n=1 Tax=Pleomassaria siparia CBS 279.74 TaxID=1314801 RepID=A0A6G1JV27_9PLEO|nr:hypothetical protein K504DRAFT_494889 [Pleomassaria siparia CBS 279.74]
MPHIPIDIICLAAIWNIDGFQFVAMRLVYNIAFHPLRKSPGPLLWRLTSFPFLLHMLQGDLTHKRKRFHETYGHCVRVAPDELSFLDGWKHIHTKEYLDRPPQWRIPQPGVGAWDLINSTKTTHARFRKAILPGFSKKSTTEQYPVIDHYSSLLIERLKEMTMENDIPVSVVLNLVQRISYAAFDLTSDLGSGRNLNCLKTGVYQPWMTILTQYRASSIALESPLPPTPLR